MVIDLKELADSVDERSDKVSKRKTHGRRHDSMSEFEFRRARMSRKLQTRDLEERRARLEAAGGEAWLAPTSEWLLYTAAMEDYLRIGRVG